MSPAISFSVFREKLLNGEKRQTIRKHRKRPIKIGDVLYLYWHMRRKDCELLKTVNCVETFTKPWGLLAYNEELTKRDGFKDKWEMHDWFMQKHNPTNFDLFDVIRW